MRIRLFRLVWPLLWFSASLTVILIYFFYIYADNSPKSLLLRKYWKNDELQARFDNILHESQKRPSLYKKYQQKNDLNDNKIIPYKRPVPPVIKVNKKKTVPTPIIPTFTTTPTTILTTITPTTMFEVSELPQSMASEINNPIQNKEFPPFNNNIEYPNQCKVFTESLADINTREEYMNFDFDAEWKKNKGIWNDKFEERYKIISNSTEVPPLHVIILPHSHNDPGWLNTFEDYFRIYTKGILDSAVKKLPVLQDMSFIWTEICFLNMWWQQASEDQKQTFKRLVHEGRIEIMSGGWVMTDEATAHIYAILDQFIEGHQWVKHELNVTPSHSWVIDPFGHGSTVPYLLGAFGFKGAIIQRIHYNWKEWLAARQYGDFIWKPQWNSEKNSQYSVLTHNMPFDMYFVDSSCGPNAKECGPFDFRWYPQLSDSTVPQKADQLIGQYRRSASLYPHNVFLAFVGGDFRYNTESEFEVQHNYKKIIDYVNANGAKYNNAKLQFGTPKDYFKIVRERMENFPTLIGDLFPYGDVFTSGEAAYWTGYFTTRPFVKIVCRELEHNLRNAEILFTIAYNKAKQGNYGDVALNLAQNYVNLINARRNLGLFQHHDAITGTSRQPVMKNYLERMYESIGQTLKIQQQAIEMLVQSIGKNQQNFIDGVSYIREKASDISGRIKLEISESSNIEIILFNSLAQDRVDIASISVSSSNVKIIDADGNDVKFQINFSFKNVSGEIITSGDEFEVIFIARLPPLSLTIYRVIYATTSIKELCTYNEIKNLNSENGKIELDSSKFKLTIDKKTGSVQFNTNINGLENKKPFTIGFGAYNTAAKKSGAYLFKPDPTMPEKDVFTSDKASRITVINGPLASYVEVIYGSLLVHTIRVLKTGTHLDEGIYIENFVNMEKKHANMEMFMRIKSPIKNDNEFYTDLNGFQWQRRKRVSRAGIGIEGNYYPITVGAFIQDNEQRLTYITDHAQGATSPELGTLEVMIDRRTPIDDQRGMEEGVTDNLPNLQRAWLTIEKVESHHPQKYQVPSIHAQNLMQINNYPVNIYINSNGFEINRRVKLLKESLPCDLHLFNLRTLGTDENQTIPSQSALLVAHRINYDCNYSNLNAFYVDICKQNVEHFDNIEIFNDVSVKSVQKTSLTALKSHGSISSFRADPIEAMELKTFNVTFS